MSLDEILSLAVLADDAVEEVVEEVRGRLGGGAGGGGMLQGQNTRSGTLSCGGRGEGVMPACSPWGTLEACTSRKATRVRHVPERRLARRLHPVHPKPARPHAARFPVAAVAAFRHSKRRLAIHASPLEVVKRLH